MVMNGGNQGFIMLYVACRDHFGKLVHLDISAKCFFKF
jgi:hypothetical protein